MADTIFTSMCLLELTNRPEPVNYLDLIFTEFNKVSKTHVDAGVFQSDNCYLLFVIPFLHKITTSFTINSVSGVYCLLFGFLSKYDLL
jgi:hypothetical protein